MPGCWNSLPLPVWRLFWDSNPRLSWIRDLFRGPDFNVKLASLLLSTPRLGVILANDHGIFVAHLPKMGAWATTITLWQWGKLRKRMQPHINYPFTLNKFNFLSIEFLKILIKWTHSYSLYGQKHWELSGSFWNEGSHKSRWVRRVIFNPFSMLKLMANGSLTFWLPHCEEGLRLSMGHHFLVGLPQGWVQTLV